MGGFMALAVVTVFVLIGTKGVRGFTNFVASEDEKAERIKKRNSRQGYPLNNRTRVQSTHRRQNSPRYRDYRDDDYDEEEWDD